MDASGNRRTDADDRVRASQDAPGRPDAAAGGVRSPVGSVGGPGPGGGGEEPVRIRPMREADLPRVVEIERSSFTMPWSEGTFRGLLRRGDAALVVAEADGELIGHAIFWAVLAQGELGDIAVIPEWRDRGIGTRLLYEIFERAKGRGVRELYLEVRISNEAAQRLYERHGFRRVGRRPGYYSRPKEDALVMCRRLEP